MLINRYKPEQMRYKPNHFSFYLCLVAILLNVLYFITIYNSKNIIPDYMIGIDIFCNIIFMLFIFLASVKSKSYNIFWSYIIYGFAIFQIGRIFVIPLRFNSLGQLTGNDLTISILTLTISAITLTVAGVSNNIKGKILCKYLSEIESSEEKNNGRH